MMKSLKRWIDKISGWIVSGLFWRKPKSIGWYGYMDYGIVNDKVGVDNGEPS